MQFVDMCLNVSMRVRCGAVRGVVKSVATGRAAQMLGVSVSALRRWDADGRLVPERTPAGRRRCRVSDVATFNPLGINSRALTG